MKKRKKHKVYVTYSEKCIRVIEDSLGCDGSYTGSRSDVYDFCLLSALTKEPINTPYWELIEIQDLDFKENVTSLLYIVYVRYRTGDTFSTSSGRGCIVSAFVNVDNARVLAKEINDGKYKGYASWNGYFNELESVEIETLSVDSGYIRETYAKI